MADPLQSWTDGQAETQVLEFVRSVTEPGSPGSCLRRIGSRRPAMTGCCGARSRCARMPTSCCGDGRRWP